mmetsp:Transcript_19308/g.21722  ORF Transcript_19308/g.21722 Transcript_19308/m.21722 type:complete len:308 (+) Transcript_19308:176-1099(+)
MTPSSTDDGYLWIQRQLLQEMRHEDDPHTSQIVKDFGKITNQSNTNITPKYFQREETSNRVKTKGDMTSFMGVDRMIVDIFGEKTQGQHHGLEKKCNSNSNIYKTSQEFVNPFQEDLTEMFDTTFDEVGNIDFEEHVFEKEDPKMPMDTPSSFMTNSTQQNNESESIPDDFKSLVLPSYQETCHTMDECIIKKRVDLSNEDDTGIDLEPLPLKVKDQSDSLQYSIIAKAKEKSDSLQYSNIEYWRTLEKLERRAKATRKSQRLIVDYDRKMGLKKSHSKTMRETRQSRKLVMAFIKSQATIKHATVA